MIDPVLVVALFRPSCFTSRYSRIFSVIIDFLYNAYLFSSLLVFFFFSFSKFVSLMGIRNEGCAFGKNPHKTVKSVPWTSIIQF